MARFSALRISKHVRTTAEVKGLPEPVGLSVTREGHLQLSFTEASAGDLWVTEINGLRTTVTGMNRGAWQGFLPAGDDSIPTTVVVL